MPTFHSTLHFPTATCQIQSSNLIPTPPPHHGSPERGRDKCPFFLLFFFLFFNPPSKHLAPDPPSWRWRCVPGGILPYFLFHPTFCHCYLSNATRFQPHPHQHPTCCIPRPHLHGISSVDPAAFYRNSYSTQHSPTASRQKRDFNLIPSPPRPPNTPPTPTQTPCP